MKLVPLSKTVGVITLVFFAVFLYSADFSVISRDNNGDALILQNNPVLIEGMNRIVLEIADTESARIRGLSGRESMEMNTGMLFVFPDAGEYSFWMKDMHFPIDIVWLDKNFVIIDIKESVEPGSFPETFTPQNKALYVLEVNAGVMDQIGKNKKGDILGITI